MTRHAMTNTYIPRQGVINSSNHYLEMLVNLDAVACFWTLSVVNRSTTFLAVPDACVDLVFDLHNENNLFLIGPYNSFKKVRFRQPCEYVGIRFMPAMIHRFMDIDLTRLKNRTVRLQSSENSHLFDLASKLRATQNNTARGLAIESWLQNYRQRTGIHLKGLMAINHIIEHQGAMALNDDFAGAIGLGLRQIRRHIHHLTGFNMKEFSRIIRFQHALSTMEQAPYQLHEDIAFFDQSHLIREFKRFTGTTPSRFFGMSVLSN